MKYIIIPFMVILLSACVGKDYDPKGFNPNCLKPADFPACPNGAVFEYASASRINRCVWKSSCQNRRELMSVSQ